MYSFVVFCSEPVVATELKSSSEVKKVRQAIPDPSDPHSISRSGTIQLNLCVHAFIIQFGHGEGGELDGS